MMPAPIEKHNSTSGFTLIEVMVAMSLLAIVFVTVFTLFAQTVRTEETTRFYTVAPMLAQKKMVEAVTGPASARFHASGEFEDYPGYLWRTSTTEVAAELDDAAASNMKRIDVTVTGSEESYRFQLRRYELSK